MSREYSRLKRVGDQIQKELALLVQREIKDPRVGLVTITGVEVSREFENAKVYVTALGDENMGDEHVAEDTLIALNKAAGFLRRELGRRMKIRTIPHLRFVRDTTTERGNYLAELIDAAVASDQKKKA
jgi:ribosome-binding factor A